MGERLDALSIDAMPSSADCAGLQLLGGGIRQQPCEVFIGSDLTMRRTTGAASSFTTSVAAWSGVPGSFLGAMRGRGIEYAARQRLGTIAPLPLRVNLSLMLPGPSE